MNSGLQIWISWVRGPLRRRTCLWPSSCQLNKKWGEWGIKDVKNQEAGCWPWIAEMYMKEMISVSPDACIFPYTEERWILYFEISHFSWINDSLLIFRLPSPCCRHYMYVNVWKVKVLVAQSCLTLCNPIDSSSSSVLGILQARILAWVAISSFRESSWHGDWTQICTIAGRFFTIWATRAIPCEYVLMCTCMCVCVSGEHVYVCKWMCIYMCGRVLMYVYTETCMCT